jgi:hypothetical protein
MEMIHDIIDEIIDTTGENTDVLKEKRSLRRSKEIPPGSNEVNKMFEETMNELGIGNNTGLKTKLLSKPLDVLFKYKKGKMENDKNKSKVKRGRGNKIY